MDREIALAPLWERVKARRRNILILVLVSTAVVAGIAFILKPWYRAETELLPPSEEESGVGVASLLRGMGMPGVKIPTEVAPGDVFMVILQSRGINEQMVERFHLRTRYKKKLMEDAIKELKAHARFKQTAAGTIQISVEDTDRQRAADMANSYVEFLDKFNREVRTSKGRRTRVFIEGRLAETASRNTPELGSPRPRVTSRTRSTPRQSFSTVISPDAEAMPVPGSGCTGPT